MKRTIRIACLAASLAGCHAPDEMLVSDAFTQHELQIVASALDEWEEAVDHDILELTYGWRPVFATDGDYDAVDGKATLHIIERDTQAFVELQHTAGDDDRSVEGLTQTMTDWWIVVVRQDDPDRTPEENDLRLRYLLLHEFGHFIGLAHTDAGLMTRVAETVDGVPTAPCIDALTLERACMFESCGPRAHPTCKDR